MRKVILFLSVIAFSAACTSYQSKGFSGGFSETRLAENAYRINFSGNGFTSRERTADFVLLRAADLTIADGFGYFIVSDSENWIKTTTRTTPSSSTTDFDAYQTGNSIHGTATTTQHGGQTTTISKPRSEIVISMFNEKPENQAFVYETKFVQKSIREKYNINN